VMAATWPSIKNAMAYLLYPKANGSAASVNFAVGVFL
jgi:hypothetical protein